MVRKFYLTFGLFLFLTNVNCLQNKRNPVDDKGFVHNFIIPGSNGLPDHFNNILNPFKPVKPIKRPNPNSFNKPNKRQFAKAALEAHNKRRLTTPHYGTKLILDAALCRDAQQYANKLARRDSGLQHAQATRQGENLSWQSGGGVSAKDVVERWFNERVTGRSCKGHYTQVVWKSSVKFCMATAVSRAGGSYTVARYFPAGNLAGARNYQDNVHQGFKDPCSMFQPFQSSFNTPRPSFNTPKPSFNTPRPSFNKPRPSFNTPKPSITTERPAIQSSHSGFAEAGLEAHNKRRATSPHYGALMVLDDKLCRDAQSYADILARRDAGLQHSSRNMRRGQGENLAYQMGYGKVEAEFVTKDWYSEKDTGEQCKGHYTQVVWKRSAKFCMATARSRRGGYYTVARYSPPGNVNGARNYRANVHPGFVKPC